MGIDHHGLGPEGIAHDQVGNLAADTGQGHEFRGALGHKAPMLVQEGLGRPLEGLGLGTEEAAASDQGLQVFQVGPGHGLRIRIGQKEVGSNLVHPLVGALGSQNGTDQKLPGGLVIQGALGFRIAGQEPVNDEPGPAQELASMR